MHTKYLTVSRSLILNTEIKLRKKYFPPEVLSIPNIQLIGYEIIYVIIVKLDHKDSCDNLKELCEHDVFRWAESISSYSKFFEATINMY